MTMLETMNPGSKECVFPISVVTLENEEEWDNFLRVFWDKLLKKQGFKG